jgi:hypothetical protein
MGTEAEAGTGAGMETGTTAETRRWRPGQSRGQQQRQVRVNGKNWMAVVV